MNRHKLSVRSRGSSSSNGNTPHKHVRECCRKFIAFMCTQVGVGGLIVGYAIVGAFSIISIETQENPDPIYLEVQNMRRNCSNQLWIPTNKYNTLNESAWRYEIGLILKDYQLKIAEHIKNGYDGRTPDQKWSFPAALMFCLSVFTMIGYGNMVPRTDWGKGATVIYATFGIPLYILYFLNMGKVLANTFQFLYTVMHECTHRRTINRRFSDENDNEELRKKVIVPSTACLWVISFYIFTGTVMFANWEKWSYLDSIYFCVTSLCKIGMGDFVPGNNADQRNESVKDQETKLAINFFYMLIGMGLVAMCYNLMREEVRVKMKELKEDLKLCMEDIRARFVGVCGDKYNDEDNFN